jgi:hypothetical protein
MVTTELNEADIFKPSILANAAVVNKANQYEKYMSFIPNTVFPMYTKVSV